MKKSKGNVPTGSKPVAEGDIRIMILPFGEGEGFAAVLTGVRGDSARVQLALWLGLAFSLAVLPSVLAVAWASRRKSPWFALAGAAFVLAAATLQTVNAIRNRRWRRTGVAPFALTGARR